MGQAIASIEPAELPSPPRSALRVVEACSQEVVDARLLADLVSQDQVLAVALLRLANSAYFARASEVTSLAHAVTLIGQRALRSLVLCIAVRDVLKAEQLPAFPLDAFWRAALCRGVCARTLGETLGLDAEACFTLGLLQDFGLLVLFHLHPRHISDWQQFTEMLPDERYELELQLFNTSHERVALQLAEAWGLPRALAVPLGLHHGGPLERETEFEPLVRLAACADWMAAVFDAESKRAAIQGYQSLLEEHFGLSVETADILLEAVDERMPEAARAFGIGLEAQRSATEIMREANLRLAQENLSYQELTWGLEQALRERDRMAQELHRELALAREVQRSLLPGEATSELGIFGVNVSAKAVSGDFYDAFRLATGKIAFCIADVSGKGMHAALLMAKVSSLFRCLAKGIHDPSRLLSMLNRELVETSIRGMFVTLIAGVFDPRSREVELANAGHLPALRMQGGRQVVSYPAMAPPLGVLADVEFPSTRFRLGPDRLYLYTDGLLEAALEGGRQLGMDGLLRLLAGHAHLPPTRRLQEMVAAVRQGGARVGDDLTILLIEGAGHA